MNLPTQLTVGRICLVPLVVVFLISTESIHALVAAVLFAGAALTDWLDGLIARRRGQVTTLGKLLDPVADKVLVSAALISLVQVGTVEAWMVVIMIGREFAVTGLRSVSAAQGIVIEASDLAKYKTFAQYLAVILLILERSIPTGLESEFVYLSRGTLWAALFLTILSGIDYFVRFYRASDVDAAGPGRRSLALSALWLLGAYLVGAIPVGYLVARILGVDIRRAGQREHRRDQRPPHGRAGPRPSPRSSVTSPRATSPPGSGAGPAPSPAGPARPPCSRWSATAGRCSSGSAAGRAWRPGSARSFASRPGP